MRRSLIAVLIVALSAAAAGPAAAALSIVPGGVRMLVPAASGGGDPAPALAARVGGAYRFEVAYTVAGARRIGTGHLFAFENAVTGERMDVLTRSFPPEAPGPYRESSELTIPVSWSPGVYRIRWTVNARHPRLESVRATGTRVFLVVG